VPLSDEELAPILENAALVDRFIAAFVGDAQRVSFLELLDGAFSAWSETTEKKGYSDGAVVEITGAAFGRFCVETLDMRWVRITDAAGIAIAVQGRVKDFRGFPYHAISKRIPLGEHGFFKPIYISLQDAAERDWNPVSAA
jgi:hypothetical protein